MQATLRISSAGIAGDPDKLLYLKGENGTELHRMFNSNSLLSLRFARWRLKREFELLTGQKPILA